MTSSLWLINYFFNSYPGNTCRYNPFYFITNLIAN